jgi:hypothetical protein
MDLPQAAIDAANRFRALGFNPLASCPLHGHPCYPFKEDRDNDQVPSKFSSLAAREGPCGERQTNIQIPMGRVASHIVLDLDGPTAIKIWNRWLDLAGTPGLKTWVVATPRGGQQWWFQWWWDAPYRIVWKDETAKHELIELLGDGRLAKIPPSVKEVNGEIIPYRWIVSPDDQAEAAAMPKWLQHKVFSVPPTQSEFKPIVQYEGPKVQSGGFYNHRTVIQSIPDLDKLALAEAWGLRVVTHSPNASSFVKCKSIRTEDRNPSASFSVASGYYSDLGRGEKLSLFDLGAALGVYASWKDAVNDLGRKYNAPEESAL